MDGHQLQMLLEEENPYSGADGEYNGHDIIDCVYNLLLALMVSTMAMTLLTVSIIYFVCHCSLIGYHLVNHSGLLCSHLLTYSLLTGASCLKF